MINVKGIAFRDDTGTKKQLRTYKCGVFKDEDHISAFQVSTIRNLNTFDRLYFTLLQITTQALAQHNRVGSVVPMALGRTCMPTNTCCYINTTHVLM